MKRALVGGLALVVGLGTVIAQPKKTPAPPAGKGSGSGSAGSGAGSGSGTGLPKPEKGDSTNVERNNTDTDRPWAVGVSPERQEAAFKKTEEGAKLLGDGLQKQAAPVFREALKIWDHPAIHYNLALCLQQDDPIEAHKHFLEATKYGERGLADKQKFERAKENLVFLEKLIAKVEVSCDKVGAEVLLDGQTLFVVKPGAPNKYAGEVLTGKHTFAAKKTGYNAQVEAEYIGAGENFRINLKLYTAEELTRYHRKWDKKWIPYAVIGGGALLALGGGLFELSAQSSFKDFDTKIAKCNMDSMSAGCDVNSGGLKDLKSSGETKRTVGFVGYGVGAAAALVGAYLIYYNRETSYSITADQYIREENERKQRGGVTFNPIVAPGLAGAMVQGRF